MMIVWDEPKRQTNLAKHGLDFADLDEAFFLSSLVVPAKRTATWRLDVWQMEPSQSCSRYSEPKVSQ